MRAHLIIIIVPIYFSLCTRKETVDRYQIKHDYFSHMFCSFMLSSHGISGSSCRLLRPLRFLLAYEQAFPCLSLDQYSMLKRKKLLRSCSSPGLFGVPEKLQGTVSHALFRLGKKT